MTQMIDLAYALPSSRLCIDSKLSITEDDVLGGDPQRTPQSTVSLEVGAAPRDQVLSVAAGWFFNTNVSLETTDDGRLKSTDIELGGEAGKVVVGVVGGAVALAGAFLAPPVAGVAGLRTLAAAEAAAGLAEPPSPGPTPRELEEAAFEEQRPDVAAMRTRYIALVEKTTRAIAETSEQLLANLPASVEKETIKRLKRLEDLRRRYSAELDRLNDLFKAWRSSTQRTRIESYQRYIELDQIRGLVVSDGVEPDLGGAPAVVRFAWETLGVVATVDPAGEPQEVATGSRENAVLVRFPRLVEVSVFERDPTGKAVLRERKPHLVMDAACETRTVKLRKSVWSKRGVKLGFSEIGTLTSFGHNTTSGAAAAAGAAGEVPAKVAESLEAAGKARKQLGSLSSVGLEEELNGVKQQAEKKQQELTLAGLTAGDKDHRELARLKLKAEIVEQRQKAGESKSSPDPTAEAIDELKQQVELLWLEAAAEKLKSGPGA